MNVYSVYEIPLPNPRRGENNGIFPIIFPHIVGAVLGFAIARMFHGGLALYIIFGLIFAFAMGTWKSWEIDRIELKYAALRNLIIMMTAFAIVLAVCLFFGIMYLFGWIVT